MNKRNLIIIGAVSLAVILIATIIIIAVTCGGGKIGGYSKKEFKDAGLSSGFTANVKGKAVEIKNADKPKDSVVLKWQDSDEQSYGNVVKMLKDESFAENGGGLSSGETINLATTVDDMKAFYATKVDGNKTMYAIVIFFLSDGNFGSASFVKNDLYFIITVETQNSGGDTFEYGLDYINQKLGDNYWIAYNVTAHSEGDTESYSYEVKRTSAGFLFRNIEDDDWEESTLFIKKGVDYDIYAFDEDSGTFELSYQAYPAQAAEALSFGLVWPYMTMYNSYGSLLTKAGSDTVAERSCDKYSFNYSGYGVSYKYNYSIDKATGVCLKFTMDLAAGGQKVGYEFACTKFQVGGVTLPSYE